jgi:HPt (histidine-containing phosphotransfer) domain-containing protein
MGTLPSTADRRLEDEIPSCDRGALARLRGWGGMPLVHDLVHLFGSITPGRLRTVRTALDSGDSPAAEAAAHTLGSSAGQLGAARMQRLCMQIEALSASGRVADALPLLPEMEDEYQRHRAWLAQETMTMERLA